MNLSQHVIAGIARLWGFTKTIILQRNQEKCCKFTHIMFKYLWPWSALFKSVLWPLDCQQISVSHSSTTNPGRCVLLTALKASSRFLCVGGATALLEFAFLGGLLVEGFLFWGSAAGGTCSLLCFFSIFSKQSYTVSDMIWRCWREQGSVG